MLSVILERILVLSRSLYQISNSLVDTTSYVILCIIIHKLSSVKPQKPPLTGRVFVYYNILFGWELVAISLDFTFWVGTQAFGSKPVTPATGSTTIDWGNFEGVLLSGG